MNERAQLVLSRLERTRGDFWNVSPDVGLFLNTLVKLLGARKVLEIGTSNGYCGLWISEALSHTGGVLYTVESHRERFALARESFEEAGMSSFVRQIYGHAPEVFEQPFGEKSEVLSGIDLVFLDATKIEYASYFYKVLPLLSTNALLLADNAISHKKELKEFFEATEKSGMEHSLLPLGSGILVVDTSTGSTLPTGL